MLRSFKSKWKSKKSQISHPTKMDGLSVENTEEIASKESTPCEEVITEKDTAAVDDTSKDDVDEIDVADSGDDLDDNDDDDIDKMLNELQGFQEELEQESLNFMDNSPAITPLIRAPSLPSKALDEFRFSVTAMEDTGEVDLDALLEDLCIMEKDLNSNNSTENTEDTFFDNNSFSPKVNSPISPTAKVPADVRSRLESVQEENKELTLEEQQERIKAEKIRIALEKLRAARVKKLVVKVYNDDDPTSKTIAIDQTWTAWEVSKKMMIKNDAEPDPNWVLLERLSDLCVERCLEDHESVVDVVSYWPWENENRIVISNKSDKYALFRNPQNYLLSSGTSAGAAQLAEKSKDILIEEHFQADAMRLPELEGVLYLKEGKKSWKKHFFVLRASGIYYTPKGKTKSSKDLVCLVKFEFVSVFSGGAAFKKKFKAPTEHCFVLKHPEYHEIDSKAIKYFCAEDQKTFQRWTVCIRLAKYGYQMLEDYAKTQDEMDRIAFSLDKNRFPKASSFSAGQKPESNAPQISDAREKAVKTAKAQSEKLKLAIGNNPGGSQSFSVSRKPSTETKQPKKKSIGNLFSDAWKKGDDPEDEVPISPNSPSSTSAGMTPNTTEPKSFNIENAIIMDEISEEEHPPSPLEELPPPPPPQPTNDIVPPPPRPQQLNIGPPVPERQNIGPPVPERQNGQDDVTHIPSPTDIKTMLEGLQSSPPPQLTHKGVSIFPALHSSPPHAGNSPPGLASFKARSLSSPPPPPSGLVTNEPPLPPPPHCSSPPALVNKARSSSVPLPMFIANEPPPPPPPVARKPSRSNSVRSQHSDVDEVCDADPFVDQTADFPPPPPLPHKEVLPPPVKRKPSRSGSVNENGNIGNKKITRIAEMGSTDSLDNIPLPPPPLMMPVDSDADLPPPPPEVLLKNRSNSESRDRSNSNNKPAPAPPPPPPKKGRARTSSNDRSS